MLRVWRLAIADGFVIELSQLPQWEMQSLNRQQKFHVPLPRRSIGCSVGTGANFVRACLFQIHIKSSMRIPSAGSFLLPTVPLANTAPLTLVPSRL